MHQYKNRDLLRKIRDFVKGRNKYIRGKIEEWKKKLEVEIRIGSGSRSSNINAIGLKQAADGYMRKLDRVTELGLYMHAMDPLGPLPVITDVRPSAMSNGKWGTHRQEDLLSVNFEKMTNLSNIRKNGSVSISAILMKHKNEPEYINKWLDIKPSSGMPDPEEMSVGNAWENLAIIFLTEKMIRRARTRDVCRIVESFAGEFVYVGHDFEQQKHVQCVKRKLFKKAYKGRNKKAANLDITFKTGELIKIGINPSLQYFTDPKKRHIWAWNKTQSIVSHIISMKYE